LMLVPHQLYNWQHAFGGLCCKAAYHSYVRATAGAQTIRVPLSSPQVVGFASSRGTRSHQEDHHQICAININPSELQTSIKRSAAIEWDTSKLPPELAGEVLYAGLYDGHGGAHVAKFLQEELHILFEEVNKDIIPEVFAWVKSFGGYFKRFRGGALTDWIENPKTNNQFDLDARSTLAFLEVSTRYSTLS